MPARSLNLGILAHVDAGKTTLTERLLHLAGVIDQPGSVDSGTTQTDTLALERRRGITIRAAVVAFPLGDLTVNVVDTPGHPDFIAEVERSLVVLDGAVLVLSAVEGVQPQTRILMRALQRLHVPTLLFVNKVDRPGADLDAVLGRRRAAPESRHPPDGHGARRGEPRRRVHGVPAGRPRLPRPGDRGARRARRGPPRGVRRRARSLRPPAAARRRRPDGRRPGAPGVRRVGRHRCRCPGADGGHRRPAPRSRAPGRRRCLGSGVQGGARRGRREGRLRPGLHRLGRRPPATRPARRSRRQGGGPPALRGRTLGPVRAGGRRPDRAAARPAPGQGR